MWPFKREPKISLEEYAAQQPVPPCGDSLNHYEWVLQLGVSCPKCARKKLDKQKEIDENRMAEKITILETGLEAIIDLAHDRSTGPAVPDTLWEIRNLALTFLENSQKYHDDGSY